MGKRGVTEPWFARDPGALQALRATLKQRFPTLHVIAENGVMSVRGSFGVTHAGAELDWYQINVVLPHDYPSSPPRIFEVGGRIPRVSDRHVNPDETLCLGVNEEIWMQCESLEIGDFLEGPVRSYLIGNSLVEQGQPWPHGERSHGAAGVQEFYAETTGISDARKIVALLQILQRDKVKGHWPCPCGSGNIIRKCHADIMYRLHQRIPRAVIEHSIAVFAAETSP